MATAGLSLGNVTIPSGATDSDSFFIGQGLLCAIQIPTVTGASFTLKNSIDGVNYSPVCDDAGNIYTITATDGAYIALDAYYTAGLMNVKIISASSEAAMRTLTLLYKQAA